MAMMNLVANHAINLDVIVVEVQCEVSRPRPWTIAFDARVQVEVAAPIDVSILFLQYLVFNNR
jgi:hypothetical protein